MGKKYLVSKLAAIFFSITTVILFVVSHSGVWAKDYATIFVVVYMVNFFLLVTSLTVFIWQRARRDNPKQYSDMTILEHVESPEVNKKLSKKQQFYATYICTIRGMATNSTNPPIAVQPNHVG